MKRDRTDAPVEILLAEDNPGDAELITEHLAKASVPNHVTWAKNGDEAMDALRQEGVFSSRPRPDLLLLDLNMPGMDGREVLAAVKADRELATIPVVVLSGSKLDEDIVRSYELQAACYITKPADYKQFGDVIRTIESFWLRVVHLPAYGGKPVA